MNTTPDMTKVRQALNRYGRKPAVKPPPPPPGPPMDAALRKPLKAHGIPCRSGFSHPHFLHGS